MAYSDIQEKLGQQRMANSVLLAEKYSQGNLFPKGSEGNPHSKDPRAVAARKKREYQKAQEKKAQEAQEKTEAKRVSDEARQREWDARKKRGEVFGDMPPDFNLMETLGPSLNKLLQIGGAAGSMIPFMGGNMLKMLIGGPNAMAMNVEDALPRGGFVGTKRTNVYVNDGGEAFIREPNGNFKFDGFYDPATHGPIFPGLGLVQNQSNNDMKIAKLPHSPPTEKIVLPNGKIMDSPLRFKTDQERIKFMEDFSRGYGRYSQTNTPMTIAQRGADGAHTNVKIYEEKDGYGNTNKKVLPYFGGTYGGPIRPKKV